MERKKILGVVAAGLASVYAADFIDELGIKRQGRSAIWDFDTEGLSWAWTVGANWLMKLTAGGMVSHHPDFKQIPEKSDYELFKNSVSPNQPYDYTGREQPNFWDYALAHSVFGIREAAVFGLDQKALDMCGANRQFYHYAFRRQGAQGIWMSSKVIPAKEQIKVLVDKELDIWALNPKDLAPLPAVLSRPYDRFDPKLRRFRQF